ncbi:hypothetical protein SNEBB_006885 [Seison nebaliae]|nr:hypothetical protein SNEBB_006885 [Seison nebaliae]
MAMVDDSYLSHIYHGKCVDGNLPFVVRNSKLYSNQSLLSMTPSEMSDFDGKLGNKSTENEYDRLNPTEDEEPQSNYENSTDQFSGEEFASTDPYEDMRTTFALKERPKTSTVNEKTKIEFDLANLQAMQRCVTSTTLRDAATPFIDTGDNFQMTKEKKKKLKRNTVQNTLIEGERPNGEMEYEIIRTDPNRTIIRCTFSQDEVERPSIKTKERILSVDSRQRKQYDRYQKKIRPKTTQIIHQGRLGSSWRHIKEVKNYTGSNLAFLDGSVSLADMAKSEKKKRTIRNVDLNNNVRPDINCCFEMQHPSVEDKLKLAKAYERLHPYTSKYDFRDTSAFYQKAIENRPQLRYYNRLRNYDNIYHTRAKENYKYWTAIEGSKKNIPKRSGSVYATNSALPSLQQQYAMGAHHTVLGLGDAPRN